MNLLQHGCELLYLYHISKENKNGEDFIMEIVGYLYASIGQNSVVHKYILQNLFVLSEFGAITIKLVKIRNRLRKFTEFTFLF